MTLRAQGRATPGRVPHPASRRLVICPSLILLLLTIIKTPACTQSWIALGSGVDGPVYCLAVYGGQLHAGGKFSTAGGAVAAHIARWDGATWFPVGSGTDGPVHALYVFGGELYAGGDFTSCGGAACSYVAKWDGTGWTPVGNSLNGPVHSFADYGGSLYVGGAFTAAGGRPAKRIAMLEGDAWREVSGGVDSAVYALKVTDASELFADLYIGGAFTGQGLSRVAWYHPAYQTWLATEWDGFNAPVLAFANYPGGLIAGGSFTSNRAGSRTNHLAQRGNEFSGGADGEVHALHSTGSHLYAGGEFGRVGPPPGLRASNIAKWNGAGWESLGTGTNGTVRAIVTLGGETFAGGDFDTVGGVRADHVARWGPATDIRSAPAALPLAVRLLQNFPNPFNPVTTIAYQLPSASAVRLAVYDLHGREVSVLVNDQKEAGFHEVQFNARGLSSGVYLCRLHVRPPDSSPSETPSREGDLVLVRGLILVR